MAEAAAAAEEAFQRYGTIFQEIADNDLAKRFVKAIVITPRPEDFESTPEDAAIGVMLSIFANGVMIGMEMEKP
jgi:hypothetical protein